MRILIFIPLVFSLSNLLAQPGTLDPSFDLDGLVQIDFNGGGDFIGKILPQEDGSILVLGESYDVDDNSQLVMSRLLGNGSIDESFADQGYRYIPLDKPSAQIRDAQQLPDGSIIIGGGLGDWVPFQTFFLAKISAEGILDSNFGNNGVINEEYLSSGSRATNILLEGNEHFIVSRTGIFGNPLVRYDLQGNIDESFGIDGLAIFDPEDLAYPWRLRMLSDGSIIAGGTEFYTGGIFNGKMLIKRFSEDGVADFSFGVNGSIYTDFGLPGAILNDICVLPDDRFLVVYTEGGTNVRHGGVARFLPSGILDETFGVNGIAKLPLGAGVSGLGTNPRSVAYDNNEHIFVVGSDGDFITSDAYVAKFSSAGILDVDFGDNGFAYTDFGYGGDPEVGGFIQIMEDQRILIGGVAIGDQSADFTLAMFLNTDTSNSEESTFPQGKLTLSPNPASEQIFITGISRSDDPILLSIFNAQGGLSLRKDITWSVVDQHTDLSIDIAGLPPGVYWLVLENSQEQQTETFIVK
ncbi:MAG: T9SS type A sorting domain-containing protein [Bacteroidota bacterium]